MNNYLRINPLEFPDNLYPIICLCDNRQGFLSWLIKSHSSGNYNHICELYKKGIVATQNFDGYKEMPIKKYLTKPMFLKFWRIDMTELQQLTWLKMIRDDLDKVWWKRRYDFLGLIGQALHIRWLQSPFANYCSEKVNSRVRVLFNQCLDKPTPSEFDTFLKSFPPAKVLGYYFE